MNNRDYLEVLLDRARTIVGQMERELRAPKSDDGKFAPHVAQERIRNVAKLGAKLKALEEATYA
jgi:hypothetical protein